MGWLHDRMPVTFAPGSKEMRLWLDSSVSWTSAVQQLLHPAVNPMQIYQGKVSTKVVRKILKVPAVPTEVGRVGTDSPSFIEPVSERADGIKAMFARQQSPKKPDSSSASAKPPQISMKRKRSDTDKDPVKKKKVGPTSSPTRSPAVRRVYQVVERKLRPNRNHIKRTT